ncbi:hypothetical protein [Caenimonas aquaedulcis]|uniref:SGNH hydrolase-type esterase domain-containing protein n=1 Tax=Caenimonas aquaedulcis TaxID=2793270 RepID=A0A931H4X4_9BURK|nr:hypothetical protein [Caenimonas aquaedulcis]MBG9388552.1 hypothetical protein [Caenimonas aquaedulcis]
MNAARVWAARAMVCGATALLVACGGGGADGSSANMGNVPAPMRAGQQPMADPAPLTADQAMDWAETNYPQYFPTAGKSAGNQSPYTYRYYPNTGNYLGVSVGVAVPTIYLFGPVSGNASSPVPLAPLADYTCTILPANCASLSRNIATWGDSLTPPFSANLGLFYPDRTVFNGGVSSQSSFDVLARIQADTAKHGWISVFWFGHNNNFDPEQVKRDMAASVAALTPGNNRFVVLGLILKAEPKEAKGTPLYYTTLQLNKDLEAMYPNNYIDIRAFLMAHYNPSLPQDVADYNNDVIPTSLRHDEDHLNNDGSVLVAQRVRDFINAKGW